MGYAALVAACSNPTETHEKPKCEVQRVDLAFGEPSALGFSGADRFAPVAGQRTCTWNWNDPGSAGSMTPSPGEVKAEMSLSYDGGPVYLLDSQRVGGSPDVGLYCGSSLEVVGKLQIVTSDTALQLVLDAPVQFQAEVLDGSVSMQLSDDEISGTYAYGWTQTWALSNRVLKTQFKHEKQAYGELLEEGHNTNADSGPIVIEGAVFRSADWACTP
ncbi:MAG: hypothetical protein HS104_00015 [Polyangiaceae bacterium]|nr:hypothetical protein [Polyangiaceae bacterium]MBK8996504.1 hypothetical protein [Myxococcales bacterium]